MKAVPHIVIYDDQCPLCTFQMRVLTWLDWCNVLSLVPLSAPQAKSVAPQLTRDDLLAAIHCVTAEKKIYRGARCLRFVGMRMPLVVPLALILWIPGVIWIATSRSGAEARNVSNICAAIAVRSTPRIRRGV